MTRARKIVLPVLVLTRVCDANAEGAIKQVIQATDVTPEITYYTRSKSLITNEGQQKSNWVDYSYNLFPVVLDRDGCPWDAAMAYLFWKIDGCSIADMSTFHGIAADLAWNTKSTTPSSRRTNCNVQPIAIMDTSSGRCLLGK
jgi:hypothetical protein